MVLALSKGALMTCVQGSAPSVYDTTPAPLAADGLSQQIGTVTQAAPGLNIRPFGTCAVLTAAALGVPQPCVPATVAWMPPATMATVAGQPVATVQSLCPCMVGGTVTVVAPGQALVDVI